MIYSGEHESFLSAADNIPTTGRSAAVLAKRYGYESISDLADSLPQDGKIADIGAGLSRLGHEVARLRTDIEWINIDPCYDDPAIYAQAKAQAPPNVMFLDAAIGDPSPELQKLKVDRIFSNWVLAHLSLDSDEPARIMASHMYELLKPKGEIHIGPVQMSHVLPFRYGKSVHFKKNQISQEDFSRQAVEETKLWWFARLQHRVTNRYKLHYGVRFVGGLPKQQRHKRD